MRKMMKAIVAVLAVSAVMVGSASAGDKLVVKGTGGAAGNVLKVDDTGLTEVRGVFSTSDSVINQTPILSVYNNDILRTKVRPGGIQEWFLNSGSVEAGKIGYGTPGGGAGISFYTGATYNLNRMDIASYPDISGAGPAALIGYAQPAVISLNKTTGFVGLGQFVPTAKLDVDGDRVRIRTGLAPAQGTTCNPGDITWGANFIYVCTATNTWKQAALTSY